ncbi:MAG: GrpB family protein [Acidobacteriia bacterium]|nr:GrpB family protein [Terriglobia bacterium]
MYDASASVHHVATENRGRNANREVDANLHKLAAQDQTETNLHVFSVGCLGIDRVLMFRDALRSNTADRDLYARTKLALARQEWKYVQNYADAKGPSRSEIE